jgi:hypothetical protein
LTINLIARSVNKIVRIIKAIFLLNPTLIVHKSEKKKHSKTVKLSIKTVLSTAKLLTNRVANKEIDE